MALTMTRTRTQTTLTKLAQIVANLHGELVALEQLIATHPQHAEALQARKKVVEADRDALYMTLRQFDPELDPTAIGASDEWWKQYGRRGSRAAVQRYFRCAIAQDNVDFANR